MPKLTNFNSINNHSKNNINNNYSDYSTSSHQDVDLSHDINSKIIEMHYKLSKALTKACQNRII